ncbi:FG-GAP-like repeat-containing protein [Streptomyces sp. NPDC060022]|uniref:FG-GAP-like repeat-containing protein n=1 Tax=Streptomyces sp. NPDC060022 TaxID=3347039 RepID=UPI0036B943D5
MRKSSRFITAALVPTLTLGVVGLGTTATTVLATASVAAADQSGPWSVPTAFTDAADIAEVVDVQTTADGTTVAVWYRTIATTRQLELRVAVRSAGSAVWGPAQALDTLPEGRESVSLVPSSDGSATVTWVNATESSSTIRTATLAKGAASWSAPVDIATAAAIGEVAFAGSPSGTSLAVWRKSEGRNSLLYVSERSGTNGSWSAPAVLVAANAYWPQAAVAADGTITVAWAHNVAEGMTVNIVSKTAGATGWAAPSAVSAPNEGGAPVLTSGPDGTTAVAWVAHREGAGEPDVVSAVKPAGSGQWGALHTIPSASSAQLGSTLVGPNGDVTLVWIDYSDSAIGVRTATRSAATDTWSAVKTLSSGYVPEQFDANIGADGTVQVGWAQDDATAEEGSRVFFTAARDNGVWTTATELSKAPSGYAAGAVSVAPDGNATAVWAQDDQLWTAGTGLPTTPPPTPAPAARRDYVGTDGFPDLYARTSTGGLLIYKGNASQTVSAKIEGGTWPTTSTLVPFGDLNGDGCNDTLVRDSSGQMHRHTAQCGFPVTPESPSLSLGTGWNAFDGFAYSGDFNRDGIPDLIARQISSGDLYLFTGTKTGTLTRVGRVGTSWKSLTIVGAGDLNGDKVGDILARTTTGDLYRYYGSGTGTIGSGAKIGSGWGGMADFVGIGDLTGDGKDDILGRTTTGDLYRYAGNGTGGVGSGVKIGTGWKAITSVS